MPANDNSIVAEEGQVAVPAGPRFIDPQMIVDQLDFQSGMRVADFGCGPGYFSLPIAEKIGEEGLVYALDILPQKLESVNGRAKNLGLTNIITQRANLEKANGSGLEAESADWVIMKDMLFQNKNKAQVLEEAWRIMKPGAKALVVEWKPEAETVGPSPELRISEAALVKIAEQGHLKLLNKIDAGNFHYGLVLVKE